MAKFRLEIITPERRFYDGQVDSLVIDTGNEGGKLGILAGHMPMVAALAIGSIRFKTDGEWKSCFCSEGFVEVRPDETFINAQAMEWPDEIDAARAEEAKRRAEEEMRQEQSLKEYNESRASLARAMARLRVKSSINND